MSPLGAVFFLFILLASPRLNAQDPIGRVQVDDWLHQLSILNQTLRSSTTNCTWSDSVVGHADCGWISVCQRINLSFSKARLYESPFGGSVANTNFYTLRQDARRCSIAKGEELLKSNPELRSLLEKTEPSQKKLEAAKANLEATAKAHGDEATIRHMLGDAVKALSLGTTERELSYQLLENGAVKNGEKPLSAPTREKLNALLTLQANLSRPLEERSLFEIDLEFSEENLFQESPMVAVALLQGNEKVKAALGDLAPTIETSRVEEIFGKVKGHMLALLERKRTNSNTAEIDNLITRLNAAHLDFNSLPRGFCQAPNAWYEPNTGAFAVCPQKLGYPYYSLFFTIAHELGHAIDPCIAFHEVSTKELKAPGIQFSRYPMSTVVECLMEPKSLGALALREDEYLLSARENFQPNAVFKSFSSLEPKLRREYAAQGPCFRYINHVQEPQVGEATSDWLAAEVLGAELSTEKDVARRKVAALEATLTFASIVCPRSPAFSEAHKALKALGCSFQPEISAKDSKPFGPHPKNSARIERLILARPVLRGALSCRDSAGVRYCD